MKFNPNYKTPDGVFEVMLDKTLLTNQTQEPKEYWVSKYITYSLPITVYNKNTNRLSSKSIYYKPKIGFYFKGKVDSWHNKVKTYRIDELVKISNDNEAE